jgi:hypothetical protein
MLRKMARERRIHLMKENFKEVLNGKSIGQHFGIPLKIMLDTNENEEITTSYICTFTHFKPYYYKMDLPFELNCIVLSYLYEYSNAIFHIHFPRDYPFKPTRWELVDLKSNIDTTYVKAVIWQNQSYLNSWSPAITLEKDILYMIENIYRNY